MSKTIISYNDFHNMRNEAYAMAVDTGLMEDTDSNWVDFDEKYYDYLIKEKGFVIADQNSHSFTLITHNHRTSA